MSDDAPFGIPDAPIGTPECDDGNCGICAQCVDQQRHAAAYDLMYPEDEYADDDTYDPDWNDASEEE